MGWYDLWNSSPVVEWCLFLSHKTDTELLSSQWKLLDKAELAHGASKLGQKATLRHFPHSTNLWRVCITLRVRLNCTQLSRIYYDFLYSHAEYDSNSKYLPLRSVFHVETIYLHREVTQDIFSFNPIIRAEIFRVNKWQSENNQWSCCESLCYYTSFE